jgi:predicted ester cyclase
LQNFEKLGLTQPRQFIIMATRNLDEGLMTPINTKKIEEYRELYQLYLEHCNSHNFEAMESFYTSPLNVNDEPWDPKKVTAQFKPLVTAFPDWHWEVKHLTIEGDFLALHFTVAGTHKGNFQGIEPTGRRVTTSQFTLYHVVDGKFADVWDLLDIESVVKQIK